MPYELRFFEKGVEKEEIDKKLSSKITLTEADKEFMEHAKNLSKIGEKIGRLAAQTPAKQATDNLKNATALYEQFEIIMYKDSPEFLSPL